MSMADTASLEAIAPELGLPVADLLRPIQENEPSGEFLFYDLAFREIRKARMVDSDPGGDSATSPRRANWPRVKTLCLELLTERTKDLQVSAWLMESLTHLHGFKGTAAGGALFRMIATEFWDTVYPRIRDDDVEPRIAPQRWIDHFIVPAMSLVPLTRPEHGDRPPLNWSDWRNAERLAEIIAGRRQRDRGSAGEAGPIDLFLENVADTPLDVLGRTREDAEIAVQEVDNLWEWRRQRWGEREPRLHEPLRTTAHRIFSFVDGLYRDRGGIVYMSDAGDDGMADGTAGAGSAAAGGAGAPPAGDDADGRPLRSTESAVRAHILTREDAYRRLEEAADFLLKTEPHSPVPHLVKRAITWGRTPFNELYRELMRYDSGGLKVLDLLDYANRNNDR